MSHYRFGRALASLIIWAGCLVIGIGIVMTVVTIASKQNLMVGGASGLGMALWGAIGALLGAVSRAIFDIADVARGQRRVAAPDSSIPFPLATRDPG